MFVTEHALKLKLKDNIALPETETTLCPHKHVRNAAVHTDTGAWASRACGDKAESHLCPKDSDPETPST